MVDMEECTNELLGKPLTGKELKILRLAADGCSNSDIAGEYGVSSQAVRHYFHRISRKFGVSGRTAAVAVALKRGLLNDSINFVWPAAVVSEVWTVGLPGGPAGPFYSIVTQTGRVIALQVPDRAAADMIAAIPQLVQVAHLAHGLSQVMAEFLPDYPEAIGEDWQHLDDALMRLDPLSRIGAGA
jgi:DNA-binding CsgD family transcriptional regulator